MTAGLDSLPFEVFNRICLYLRATELLALANVSRSLRRMLRAPIWKRRLLSMCPNARFPCIKEIRYPWARATLHREMYMRLFAHDRRDALYHAGGCTTNNVIDAMHIPRLAPHLLFVGDRGRTVSTFRCSVDNDCEPYLNPEHLSSDSKSHSGWIWAIDSCDRTVITGSWDGSYRVWSLTDSGLCSLFNCNFRAAILCSVFIDQNTIVAGLADRKTRVVDLRAPCTDGNGLRLHHRKSVISLGALADSANDMQIPLSSWLQPSGCGDSEELWTPSGSTSPDSISTAASSISSLVMEMEGDNGDVQEVIDRLDSLMDQQPVELSPESSSSAEPLGPSEDNVLPVDVHLPLGGGSSSVIPLFTGSSDHSMYGWDLRRTLTPVVQYQFDHYPRHMSLLGNGELWVAERPNRIHLFDVHYGQFERLYLNELPDWPRGFGKLAATPGCVVVAGVHGTVEAFHPTCPLVPMSKTPVAVKLNSEPTCLAVRNGLVAVGTSSGSIHMWASRKNAL